MFQRVVLNGIASRLRPVLASIPKGLILDPLCFLFTSKTYPTNSFLIPNSLLMTRLFFTVVTDKNHGANTQLSFVNLEMSF